MSIVDTTPFKDAEDALRQAAEELQKIGRVATVLSEAQRDVRVLVDACTSLVSASETLSLNGAKAMAAIAEANLKDKLDQVLADLRTNVQIAGAVLKGQGELNEKTDAGLKIQNEVKEKVDALRLELLAKQNELQVEVVGQIDRRAADQRRLAWWLAAGTIAAVFLAQLILRFLR